jgi:hypothetical protein
MPMAERGNREMPTFFVIGAAKCGTTSLHYYLDLHPDISMSRVKEPRYFCRQLADRSEPVVRDRSAYLELFDEGTRHRGESSVRYSDSGASPGIPEAIAREAGDARFVYLVRDPIERIASSAQQELASRFPSMSWRTAGAADSGQLEMTGLVGEIDDPANPMTGPSRYMTQIRAYLDFFPSESILVVDADDLRSDREQTIARIFEFLGLPQFFDRRRMGVELNREQDKAGFRPLRASPATAPAARRILARLPHSTRTRLALWARRLAGTGIPKPKIERGLRRELEEHLRPEVEELREFTGQSFSGWSI